MNATQVFCDVHHEPMEFVVRPMEFSALDEWRMECFRCNVPGCLRHFRETQGYVDIDSYIHGKTRKMRSCPNTPEHYSSVAIVGFSEGEPIWRCIHNNCAPKSRSPFVGSVFALA